MSTLNVASPRVGRKPTRPRKPRYTNPFKDRHGKQRCYFRRNGIRVAMRAEMYTPEWWVEYGGLLGGQPPTPPKPTLPRVRPGTIDALITIMLGAAEFREDLGRSTRRAYRRPVAVLSEFIGDIAVGKLTNAHFRSIVEAEWRQSLGAGNAMLVCLHRLQKIAQSQGYPALDWCIGLSKRYPANRDGHHSWTLDEVLEYRAAHPPGTMARLVLACGWHRTAARGPDQGRAPARQRRQNPLCAAEDRAAHRQEGGRGHHVRSAGSPRSGAARPADIHRWPPRSAYHA
jgi:hypothetical protein